MTKSMMNITITAAAFALAAGNAHADLGDNYARSCKLYGGAARPIGNHFVVWNAQYGFVAEMFRNNQCEVVRYLAPKGATGFAESEIWRMLIQNARVGQTWKQYSEENGTRYFATDDSLLYARIMDNGTFLEIAYKTWIDTHVGFKANVNANEQPPVQENEDSKPTDDQIRVENDKALQAKN
jgi:hypothetical protein